LGGAAKVVTGMKALFAQRFWRVLATPGKLPPIA
jgi:hypothetical protein